MQQLYQNIFTAVSIVLISISNYILLNQKFTFNKQHNIILVTINILFLIINLILIYTNIKNTKKYKIKPIITIYINVYLIMIFILIAIYIYSITQSAIQAYAQYQTAQEKHISAMTQQLFFNSIENIYNLLTLSSFMLAPILFMHKFIIKIFNKLNIIIMTLDKTKDDNYQVLSSKIHENIIENYHLISAINNIIKGLEESRRQITLSQRSLAWSDITRTIKHEINNPLTPIKITTSLLHQKFMKHITINNTLFQEYLSIINDNVYKISKILDHYSENELKNKLELQKINIISILENIVKNQKIIFSHINFSIKYKSPVAMVYCDSTQITQVFINIIKNAQETIYNIDNPQITITINQTINILTISFTDNGTGFYDINMLKKQEINSTKRINNGIGIGLATIYNIIKKHNGTVHMNNYYNEEEIAGAIITIHLPKNHLYQEYLKTTQNTYRNDGKIM